jgi:hypothetical protein
MDAEFFRMLFRYNRWANALVVAKSSNVPEAEYYATAPGLSFGPHPTPLHLRWRGSLATSDDVARMAPQCFRLSFRCPEVGAPRD